MKKLRPVILSLLLVGTMALAVPAPTYADGPQGGGNSPPKKPPPIRPPFPIPIWLVEQLVGLLR